MASEQTVGKASATAERPAPDRHVYGPRPLSALVPSLVRPAYRRRSPAAAQVLADWQAIVGPAIAAITVPLKLSAATLSIGCTGAVAMELVHLSDALLGRINGHLGQVVVERLRFVQSLPPPSRSPAPPPRAPAIAAARQAVAGLPAGALRDALERLGRVVLTDATRRDTGG